jgi:hypothetical protein
MTSMTAWEYGNLHGQRNSPGTDNWKFKWAGPGGDEVLPEATEISALNGLGKLGWELVGFSENQDSLRIRYIFKRSRHSVDLNDPADDLQVTVTSIEDLGSAPLANVNALQQCSIQLAKLNKEFAGLLNDFTSQVRRSPTAVELLELANRLASQFSPRVDRYVLISSNYHNLAAEICQDDLQRLKRLSGISRELWNDGILKYLASTKGLAEASLEGIPSLRASRDGYDKLKTLSPTLWQPLERLQTAITVAIDGRALFKEVLKEVSELNPG